MTKFNTPICQETFIHVLREIAKRRDNFIVFHDLSNPRALKIRQDDLTITHKLPEEVDVTEELLSYVCSEYNIMRVTFMHPESLNIK